MATYNKFQDFAEQLTKGAQNFGTDVYKLALSNTAVNATFATIGNVTQITAGNGYTAGGNTLSGITVSESAGVTTVQANQVVFTAAGGAIATFQYVVLYNSTSNGLVSWWDYGTGVALNDAETFTVKFSNASPGTIFSLS